jgi:Uma2 family endonuclease
MNAVLRTDEVYLSPEEYLLAEQASETKHEFLAGVVYAMAGASREHNQLARNVLSELTSQLRGKTCEPFGNDMRMRIRTLGTTFYYYPDVTVDCSGSTGQEIEQPTVIFEVLSPGTERADWGDKLINYQRLDSMRVYVLVNQFRMAVTVFRRAEGDEWKREFLGDPAATVELPEIGCALPLSVIYERVATA